MKDRLFYVNIVSILKSLDTIQKKSIAEMMKLVVYENKKKIISVGETAKSFFIIKEGIVSCGIKNNEIRKLYARDYFGEIPLLLLDNKRTMDVVSKGRTICYEISLKVLEECLGKNYKDVILFSIFKEMMSKNKFFKGLFIDSQLPGLFNIFEMKYYKNGETVYDNENDSINKKIVLVLLGSLVKVKYKNLFYNNYRHLIVKKLLLKVKFMELSY
jgi:signal-transduction protein with cAMP-binding, CBS, and nucleotidyltransferase domain